MKNIFLFLCVFGFFESILQASFIGVYDASDVNKFIDLQASSCIKSDVSQAINSTSLDFCFPVEQPLKLIIDARQHLGDLFGVNVLSPAFKNRIVYVYNQFGYWTNIAEDSSQAGGFSKDKDSIGTFHLSQTSDAEVKKMKNIPESGQGIYQIMISACQSMVKRVASSVICPAGQFPVVAILSLANKDGVFPLSTSVLCVAPADQFFIEISATSGIDPIIAPQHVLVDELSTKAASLLFTGDIGLSPRAITLKKK